MVLRKSYIVETAYYNINVMLLLIGVIDLIVDWIVIKNLFSQKL